ncbi:hypothetical protein CDL12_22777 [Handroanthus impetiginosus]|uniref:Uncharacterized protein n=1 Tax=Handroanthus impetiginosus TaxID=429701 RepID=A0A2G9GHC8_9LAMI|nr:hypothetical protein CDL12_22777 [Handroanthus impetiginosus]
MHLIRRVGEYREFHNKNLEEISKLREEVSQLRKERDQFREYTQEVNFGKKFLKSAAGKAALEAAREEGAKEFQESDMFDSAVMNQASKIYEETVQDCRRILRETGLIPMSFGVGDASKGNGGAGDEREEDVPP